MSGSVGEHEESHAPPPPRHGSSRCLVWLAVFASFFTYAAVRAPVPGPNEPHYLTKARHYWNPDWCAGDFFLESSTPHLVFYQVVGPLTVVFTLEQAAWIGRGLAMLLLAAGWVRLVSRLSPRPWVPLWAAWAFLGVGAVGNLSGEWIVGGVEAKVFGYGFAFLALADVADRRWLRSALWFGLAIAWHPVVGGWCLLAAAGAAAVSWSLGDRRWVPDSLPRLLAAVAAGTVVSLWGLLPALQLLGGTAEESAGRGFDVAYAADYVQVAYRLKHHLDPLHFPAEAWAGYGLLLATWTTLRLRSDGPEFEAFFARFVLGTLLLALIGLLLAAGPRPIEEMAGFEWRMKLLKFYWFRLADVVVPLAFAVVVADVVRRRVDRRSWLGWIAFGGIFAATLAFPGADGPVTGMHDDRQKLRDWYDVTRWIREQTPDDALFVTDKVSWAFKWYARRPEFVALKNCPQEPAGIVEWNERLQFLSAWAEEHAPGGYSPDDVRRLGEQTGAEYVVADHLGPMTFDPVYENDSFRVYRVPAGE